MHTNQRHLASYPGIPPYKSNCMKYHNINFGWQEKKTIKKFGWLIFLFNKKKLNLDKNKEDDFLKETICKCCIISNNISGLWGRRGLKRYWWNNARFSFQ